MPHKIKAAFIGEGGLLPAIVQTVLDKAILPPENVLLSKTDFADRTALEKQGTTFYPDEMNAVVKADILVVCADKKQELGTALAPIMGCTRGRIIIALCKGINVAYLAERVAKGTELLAAPLYQAEDGTYHTTMEFSKDFLPFQVEPCRDILGSICILDDFIT